MPDAREWRHLEYGNVLHAIPADVPAYRTAVCGIGPRWEGGWHEERVALLSKCRRCRRLIGERL